jgi:hypothetical protein
MSRGFLTSVVLAGLALAALGGCEPPGPVVAFNQRMFSLPGMDSAGSSCIVVRLGDSGGSSGGGGTLDLIMNVRVADDRLIVEVAEGRTVLLRRSYDEAFFQSQRVDEFTVTATTGRGMLVRNWGSYGAGGRAECSPTTDDGRRSDTPPAQQP